MSTTQMKAEKLVFNRSRSGMLFYSIKLMMGDEKQK